MTDGPMGRDGKARTQQGSREEGVRRHVTDSSELCTSYPTIPYGRSLMPLLEKHLPNRPPFYFGNRSETRRVFYKTRSNVTRIILA